MGESVGEEENRAPWAVEGQDPGQARPGQALPKRPPLLKCMGAGVWTGVGQEEAVAGPQPHLLPS
jgi:hypothetical protein